MTFRSMGPVDNASLLRLRNGRHARVIAAMGAMGLALTVSLAQAAAPPMHVADLADLSLEQLSNIVVTSVSRRPEPLADAPAAIFVITGDDIRRSGATSIPEALRLAPDLDIARADTNQYAISARGFNNVLANKLLVLIDGRTVYTPLFSGVFWEAQDVLLTDVDRIEVISGPGGTLWGENAVNGVINIITKDAARTQGTLFEAGGGNREQGAAVRYGGALGPDAHFRAYAKYFHREASELTSGPSTDDASDRAQIGFRADGKRGADVWTVQGDAYTGRIDQPVEKRDISGGNLLARWTREQTDGVRTQVQAYYDRTNRDHPKQFHENLDTFDIEVQQSRAPLPGNRLLYGAGYRYSNDRVVNSPAQAFTPADRGLRWANLFVQDEVDLGHAVTAIGGVKLQTNIYTHIDVLPNVRIAWNVSNGHLLWAAASRAVRAPSRIDRDVNFPGVPPFFLNASTVFESEIANVYEIGYRAQPTAAINYSINLFHHDFDRLRSIGLRDGLLVFANDIEGEESGISAWGTLRITPQWRIVAGGVAARERLRVRPGQADFGGLPSLGNDPRASWMLRSSWDVRPDVEIDVNVRHSGARPNPTVPAYTAVDARVAWLPQPNIELSLTGQNLFDPEHTEWGSPANRAQFGRGVFVAVKWLL